MDLDATVRRAAAGDLDAFGEVTRRFQHMAFGYCAEPYTQRPGVTVNLSDALRGCREILEGVHDAVPEEAFYFTGGIADVLASR